MFAQKSSKIVVMILPIILIALILAAIGRNFIAGVIEGYRFNRYIHVRLDTPACTRTVPGTGRTDCCQCLVAFEGRKNPSSLKLSGNSLRSKYDISQNTYFVSGNGVITDGINTVEIRDGKVLLNGTEVPPTSIPMKVLLTEHGNLENQFFD